MGYPVLEVEGGLECGIWMRQCGRCGLQGRLSGVLPVEEDGGVGLTCVRSGAERCWCMGRQGRCAGGWSGTSGSGEGPRDVWGNGEVMRGAGVGDGLHGVALCERRNCG